MNNISSQTIEKIERSLLDISQEWGAVKDLPEAVSAIRRDVDAIRRGRMNGLQSGPRVKGRLSDEAAANLGAHWLLNVERSGKLAAVCSDDSVRQKLMGEARSVLGIQQRWTGQTTTEFPLPSTYSNDIRILAAEYGVVRNQMTNFPLGIGTAKPPRHKTGMTFGSIEMSAVFLEKNPAFEFATLEPHKVGGIVITPRELEWGSIVSIGQYLAKLAAIEFARVEDLWGFLADGSATYETVKGVCKIASDNSKVTTMGAGNTAPADATVANFRSLFGLVNSRVLSTGKWYLNATWRCWLPELNTEANQYTYRELPDGTALLFGRPVVWTEVLQAYTDSAAASKYIAVFGDLNYWWFAERVNGPRLDVSADVLFHYDQIATRFIQEMDFDYMATDAAAALQTAAA